MDGDFRSQAARMPPWLRPDCLETHKHILLVKSDFKKRLENIRCAACGSSLRKIYIPRWRRPPTNCPSARLFSLIKYFFQKRFDCDFSVFIVNCDCSCLIGLIDLAIRLVKAVY